MARRGDDGQVRSSSAARSRRGARASASSGGSRRGSGSEAQTFSRDWIIMLLLAAFLVAIAGRLVYVQVVKAGEYADMAATAHTQHVTLSARRGTVYDRNGDVIASSIDATTIYANPKEVKDPENLAQQLQKFLGEKQEMTYDDYYKIVTMEDTSFAYVQRKADKNVAAKLRKTLEKKGLEGIHYLEDTKRVYPNGDAGSQVVGVADLDGVGIAGLEMQYNDLLAGKDGELEVEKGLYDLPIPDGVISETKPVEGEDIITTIDIKLQQRAERRLRKVLKKYEAQGGSVTVMDAHTGELFAACSMSKGKEGSYSLDVGKIWSVSDAYEPGSTFKAFTAVSVLANSKTTLDTSFTVPNRLKVYDYTIHDSHDHDTETMSFKRVIAESSNIGTVLASRNVSLEDLHRTYQKFGFGSNPGTDFPGVATGLLEETQDWDGVQAANITFGQGVTTTGMQVVRAYGALEQNGTMHVPHFLKDVPQNQGKAEELSQAFSATQRVAKKETCKKVKKMLRAVVTDGTGTAAEIEGFKVAGKTGTAEVAKEGGGYGGGYVVSFCGWLGGSDSDLVCLVTVDRPKTEEGGGDVCGPVFADIMSFAAERYHISPVKD